MLAHLPNRFNSLTRGHIHATRKSLQRRETVRFRQVCVCTLARLHKPPSRRLARRSRSLCRCYDCRCVYAQLLHALGARVYTSVIALLCLPTLLHVGNRRSRTPSSARPFYHAELPEASEHNDYDDDGVTSCAGVATVSSIACTG